MKPTVVDTDSIGFTFITGGSRTSFATGIAAIEASESIKVQLVARAAKIWDTAEEDVEYVDGEVRHKSDPELRLGFKDLARQLASTGGTVAGQSNVDPAGEGNSYAVHIADVEVDPDTGKTLVTRYTAIQDAGKAVHPSYVEGQIQGGVVQGIGWALNEEYYFDDSGRMMNPTFLDYRMPTSLDLPMIDTVIVEVANPGHPYGVSGCGRGAHRTSHGRCSKRHPRGHRSAPSQPPHVSRQGAGGRVGGKRRVEHRHIPFTGAGSIPCPCRSSCCYPRCPSRD